MNPSQIDKLKQKTLVFGTTKVSLDSIAFRELDVEYQDKYDTCLSFGSWYDLEETKQDKIDFQVQRKNGDITLVEGSLTCEMHVISPQSAHLNFSCLFDIKLPQSGNVWSHLVYCTAYEGTEEREATSLETEFCLANFNQKLGEIDKQDLVFLESLLDYESLQYAIEGAVQSISQQTSELADAEKELDSAIQLMDQLQDFDNFEEDENEPF